MSIGFSSIGDIQIDDMGNTGHVDSTGRNVGGHENIELALSETVHRTIALVLGHVSLQSDCLVSIFAQLFRQLTGSSFGSREDDG